ncbi:MAG: FKBP-type peptidyl-prolyl cis-trans isomerase [Cyclobacteriaceae bacterium]
MRLIRTYTFLVFLVALGSMTSCNGDEDTFSNQEQFNKEQAEIDQYIDDNNLSVSTDGTYSLRYIIKDEGDSLVAEDFDSITVTYTIRLLRTGEEVASAENLKVKLESQIIGWRILMPLIKQGGEMTMFIPSFYGFGRLGTPTIPGDSPLIVDVALNKIHHLTTEEQFAYDQSRINSHLIGNGISAFTDSNSGLKFTITTAGNEEKPDGNSIVNVSYGGFILDDKRLTTRLFDSGQRVQLSLGDLIEGWQILMPYIGEGGEIRMYIPSEFGYGTSGVPAINLPSNAVLIFDVRLNTVIE